jgi:hypothetical protein
MVLATCPKCGAEVNKDDQFCGSCGASLTAKTEKPSVDEHYVRERDVCFESRRRADYMGWISLGIFLLIVGIFFVANPNIVSDFRVWVEAMTDSQTFVRPPQGLINSAALFFGLIGVSNFFVAGVRFMAYKGRRRVLADVLSGVGFVVFSYLLYLYGNGTLRGLTVLAIELVVIGLLVMSYAAVRFLLVKEIS